MPGQGRLGDKANVPADAHGCPACPHPAVGPAISGSPNVMVNGRPALRVGDTGIHAACCGTNMWTAAKGSATVLINGKSAHRMADMNQHCGGVGQLIEGSADVIVGDSSGGGGGNSPGGAQTRARGDDEQGGAGNGPGASAGGTPIDGHGDVDHGESSDDGNEGSDGGETSFIEIELLDTDGRPVPQERFRLSKDDSLVLEGQLDRSGFARVDDLKPGSYQVSFIDLDAADVVET